MTSSKKMPFGSDLEIIQMVQEIAEIFEILILTSSSITEVLYSRNGWMKVLDVAYHYFDEGKG